MDKFCLQGTRVCLQEFTLEDLNHESYVGWLKDLSVVKNLYRLEYLKPFPFEVIQDYVQTVLKSEKDCFFSVHSKSDQKFIGTLKLGHINWRAGVADIGIMIGDKEYWGRGFGTEALRLAISYAFKTLSLRKIVGATAANNVAMCHCFEKVGFVKEAVKRLELLIDGEYVDHVHYGLFYDEYKRE